VNFDRSGKYLLSILGKSAIFSYSRHQQHGIRIVSLYREMLPKQYFRLFIGTRTQKAFSFRYLRCWHMGVLKGRANFRGGPPYSFEQRLCSFLVMGIRSHAYTSLVTSGSQGRFANQRLDCHGATIRWLAGAASIGLC